jgi:hypothetical protein
MSTSDYVKEMKKNTTLLTCYKILLTIEEDCKTLKDVEDYVRYLIANEEQ